MKKIYLLSTVCALAVLPQVALANDMYVSGAGGVSLLQDSDFEGSAINAETEYDYGYTGLITLGNRYHNGIRAELELGYRDNGVDNVGNVNATGHASSLTMMGNVLYNFMKDSRFTPYVGIGAGVARVEYENVQLVGASRVDDFDYAPAVQGIIGANYALNETLSMFTNYQYLTALNVDVDTDAGTDVDADYDNHSVVVGLRYNFGGPKPVVLQEAAPQEQAPVAMTEPEKTYLVFFDFNKATLSPEAAKVLEEAATNAHKDNVIRLTVTGHTDRSGSDEYNQRLSQKRADAVKKALSKLGVTDKEVVTLAKGENDPLVATEDGVREPQNRRVEIVYTTASK